MNLLLMVRARASRALPRDKGFIEGLTVKRVVMVVEPIHLLPRLRDPHSELLLLRLYMSIVEIFLGLRACQPIHMEEAVILFDK